MCNNAGIARADENFYTAGDAWKLIVDVNLSSVLEVRSFFLTSSLLGHKTCIEGYVRTT